MNTLNAIRVLADIWMIVEETVQSAHKSETR